MAGIPFDPGGPRFERLAETVQIAKLAFGGETFSFSGRHYQVHDYEPEPRPVQRPGPPLLLGGGGRRLLTLAAEPADIVSILAAAGRISRLSDKSITSRQSLIYRPAYANWPGW
jgi:alkanesulfonate monooxygenase SsuD/methylene tetrahydromethanopterin reductase-like flavin-dependent oxidoreductase (luciferase family)